VLHQDLGDLPTVMESSAAAIALARELQQPRDEAAQWGNLASLFVELGNFREALRAAERALALDPDAGRRCSTLRRRAWNSASSPRDSSTRAAR
jgi:tetratricopeptide (TPR) repeat protein